MFRWFHRLSAPKHFYQLSETLSPWIGWLCLITLAVGTYLSLFVAPSDYQQGESYRIIFIHVPAAWMSMFVYVVMAFAGAIGLIWKIRLADLVANAAAPIGAVFTFLALATGSLWGKPMWGTWWVWDARLTAELILLFLYLGYMALNAAIENPQTAARATALLALVGLINIPIIHYSVEWWFTLHQPATITKLDKPSIHLSMLIPLLVMAVGFKLYFIHNLLTRVRTLILQREQRTRWVHEKLLGTEHV